MIRLIVLLFLGLKIWMIVDAIRRRADPYWLWIILGIPGGSLLYFFLVRMRDPDARLLKKQLVRRFESPPSFEQLERTLESSPSIKNRLNLAKALVDAGHYERAKQEFEKVASRRPDEVDAVFGLAVCEMEIGSPEAAIEAFEKLLEEQPTYRDYAVFSELAEAYWRTGQTEEALELSRQLVKTSPRTEHCVLLASRLQEAGKLEESEEVLREALANYNDSPKHYQKRNRRWAREAQRLLSTARTPAREQA